MRKAHEEFIANVRCRAGSLEKWLTNTSAQPPVRCRAGSLETVHGILVPRRGRSLPCRQLRKRVAAIHAELTGSLPCRQLRNAPLRKAKATWRSLPCRQLRKQQGAGNCGCGCSLPCRQLRNSRHWRISLPLSSLPCRQLRKPDNHAAE